VVEEGNHARYHLPAVLDKWHGLLGQRVLRLKDYRRLAEVVVSAIEVNEGRDRDTVARSWPGDTAAVVAHALRTRPAGRVQALLGLVRF
jgi:hypothetical protein